MECPICGNSYLRCDICGDFYCPECDFCLCWEEINEDKLLENQLDGKQEAEFKKTQEEAKND